MARKNLGNMGHKIRGQMFPILMLNMLGCSPSSGIKDLCVKSTSKLSLGVGSCNSQMTNVFHSILSFSRICLGLGCGSRSQRGE